MDTGYSDTSEQELRAILLALLPINHSAVPNAKLLFEWLDRARVAGFAALGNDEYMAVRDALVTSGQAIKGKGRGGSLARATGPSRPDFNLQTVVVTPEMMTANGPASTKTKRPGKPKTPSQAAEVGDAQVVAYRHDDRRKNNPEVGLVNEASDPELAKTPWAYDPHLDPALQFDSARSKAEKLIEDALAGNDPAAMRHALEELRRMSAPYLQWTGKSERTSFEVDTVSLHVHERIDAMSILSAVSKRQTKKNDKASATGFQPGLFEAPFESMPLRAAVDFYKHDRGWANRLVAGDSLLVMNSLLQKEGMAGQVQMIYIDPPYGIKYGSNFQPFTNKRDVKDRSDADLTQEPEMIKAFRDTWELGIHSYLTYLRDRLLLAKDLLSETGSVFVQISDENLHRVKAVLDELLGAENFVSCINFQTMTPLESGHLETVFDYIVWYAKDIKQLKYRNLYREKQLDGNAEFKFVNRSPGHREVTKDEQANGLGAMANNAVFKRSVLESSGFTPSCTFKFDHHGTSFWPRGGKSWRTNDVGIQRA